MALVEITVRGIDEATRVFENVSKTAQQSMKQAEASVNSVDRAIEEAEKTGTSFGDRMRNVFDTVADRWKELTVVAGSAGLALEGFARSQSSVNATLERVSFATGISREQLRALISDLADTTTGSREQAQAMEMLIQRGIMTEEQFRAIIPELSNFGTATGRSIPEALELADGILKTFGLTLDDTGDNIDQLTRIVMQTDIPLGALQRNLGRVPEELQKMKFGLDDAAAGIQVFRERGFESREAVREFRRAVDASEGDFNEFLKIIGLTNEEWEKYVQKVKPAEELTLQYAKAAEDNMTVMEKLQANIENVLVEYGAFADLASMLAPILISLGPIVKGLTTAFKAFSLVLRMSPIGMIITGITALIAVGSLLWKNWETVTNFLSEQWDWLKNLAVEVFGGLAEYFQEFWEMIKALFIETWESTIEFLTIVWTAISDKAIEIWEGIKEFFSTIWNAIRQTIENVWNRIKTFFTNTWNSIKKTAENIWNSIRNFFTNVWNGIKNTITNTINNIRNVIQSAFNGVKNTITNIWNGIRNVTSNIWNGIRNTISTITTGIRTFISTAFSGIRTSITNVWNGIKSTTSRVWNSMINVIKSPINAIIGIVNGLIRRLNSVKIRIPKIPDWVPGIGGRGGNSIGFNIPTIPSLATGGVVSEPTLALVGDAGRGNPEIVAPQKMLSAIVSSELNKALGNIIKARRVTTENSVKQPLQIVLQLGKNDFEVFVDDITKHQERQRYRLKRT